MKAIALVLIIVTSIIGFSCKNRGSYLETTSTNKTQSKSGSSTVKLLTTNTNKVQCKRNGNIYSAESTYNSKYLNDSTTDFKDTTCYAVYIKINGFEKAILDTIKQNKFEDFIKHSTPIKNGVINNFKLEQINPDTKNGIVKLQYLVINQDVIHIVDYQLSINDAAISGKKFAYVGMRNVEDPQIEVNSIAINK